MARSTEKTYLIYKPASGSVYEKLIDIKSFPDLGGTPELLETTTLSDSMQTNIKGIQSLDALEFSANYTKTDYEKIKELEGQKLDYAVQFGDDGADGVYGWKGDISVFINGAEVNSVIDMTISCIAETVIKAITDKVTIE